MNMEMDVVGRSQNEIGRSGTEVSIAVEDGMDRFLHDGR